MLTVRARVLLATITLGIVLLGGAMWFLIESSTGSAQPLIDLREIGATVALGIPLSLVVLLAMRYVFGVKPSPNPTPLTGTYFVCWFGLMVALMVVINLGVVLLLTRGLGMSRPAAEVIGRAASFSFGFTPAWFLMSNRKRL